jgi:hypothetical protein
MPFLPVASYAGALVVGIAVMLGWRDMRYVPRGVFLVACAALTYVVVNDASLLSQAAENVLRLSGLILSVMLLSSVLQRTRDLQRISISLFGGGPLSRYLSLTFGTALVSVPLNFGSVAVVGSLVVERIREHGDSPATRNATRAVLRGFGTAPTFSPLSISVALTLTLLSGLGIGELMAVVVPFVVVMVFLGAIWREHEPEVAQADTRQLRAAASWWRFAALILAVCAGVFILHRQFQFNYAYAVTLSCLAIVLASRLLLWCRGQHPPLVSMGNTSNELAIVGGSAFIGAVISGVILGNIQAEPDLPVWSWPFMAGLVPWAFFLAGLGGVNPIVMGTLIGGVLGPIWPEDAFLGLGVAMVTGWGITAFGTPFAANALLMERLTGYRAWDASFKWNFKLSCAGLAIASALGGGLTVGLI